MSYFEDLTEYTYDETASRPGTLNVGWLDPDVPYNQGDADPQFVNILWGFCRYKVVRMRGFCGCAFCKPRNLGIVIATSRSETLKLGSAEIRVFSNDGAIFAAPNLIYHYVTVHRYRPPGTFIAAVITGPVPGSSQYESLLAALALPWS